YDFRGLFEENQQAKGKDWQGRADFEYRTASPFLSKIQWGVRYVDRDASRNYGRCYSRDPCRLPGTPDVYGTPITAVPLDYELFNPGFKGAANQPGAIVWPTPSYQNIQDNLAALRAFANMPAGGPPYDPTA